MNGRSVRAEIGEPWIMTSGGSAVTPLVVVDLPLLDIDEPPVNPRHGDLLWSRSDLKSDPNSNQPQPPVLGNLVRRPVGGIAETATAGLVAFERLAGPRTKRPLWPICRPLT